MQKENNITLTGTYVTTQITDNFEKQSIRFASKDRDGNWKDGDFEIYIKPDLIQQTGIQPGDTVKAKGFMVFSFFTKQDGTQMSFPKMIVQEVLEVEKAGTQQGYGQQPQAAQPTQPQAMMNQGAPMTPPTPGQAPTMPPQPQAANAGNAFPPGMPPQPPTAA